MKKDFYRITTDLPEQMVSDLEEKLKDSGLYLRGKYGCGKEIYSYLLKKGIEFILRDAENFKNFINYFNKAKNG